jgi:hypothetical protein
MPAFFYRPRQWIGIQENFEYTEGWSGTILNVNYPDTYTGFDTPTDSLTETFEGSGW